MNAKEFSLEFDLIYNNNMSNMAPGLNEYEKSVFLTLAQEQVLSDSYRGNGFEGFDITEEHKHSIDTLIRELSTTISPTKKGNAFYSDFKLPTSHLFTTYEEVYREGENCGYNLSIRPVTQDDLSHYLKNPFIGVKANEILRVNMDSKVRLYSKDGNSFTYKMTYLKKPYPIILEDLSSYGVSIDGNTAPLSTESVCELPEIMHRKIIMKAAQLAKMVWN